VVSQPTAHRRESLRALGRHCNDPPSQEDALGPGPAANYGASMRAMLSSTHTYIYTLNPALSIDSHAATAPPLAVLQTFTIAQGKNADFNAMRV
jgi:hypothetical protein